MVKGMDQDLDRELRVGFRDRESVCGGGACIAAKTTAMTSSTTIPTQTLVRGHDRGVFRPRRLGVGFPAFSRPPAQR